MLRGCCATRRPRPLEAPPPATSPDAASFTAQARTPTISAGAAAPLVTEGAPTEAKAESATADTDDFRERLLGAKGVLLSCLRTQNTLHVQGVLPHLPGRLRLDDLVSALILGAESGAATAFKRGEPYLRENVFLAYLDRATLTLMGAERFLPPLLELCEALAPAFDYVTVKLVLDPPDCEGPPLVNEGDVLAVQLWGEQKLELHRPVFGLPVTAPRPGPLQTLMRPGDVLYVPPGVECRLLTGGQALHGGVVEAAGSAGVPTLYVLLMLRSRDQNVDATLNHYLVDLLRDCGFSQECDGFLRSAVIRRTSPDRLLRGQPASLGGDTSEGQDEIRTKLEDKMARCAEELASRVTGAGLRRHYAARIAKRRQAQKEAARANAATRPRTSSSNIVTTSLVQVTKGVQCQCKPGDSYAMFKRGTDTLNLPIAETASSLINCLSDGRAHVVESLPCRDVVERLCVCQILVLKGCLEVADGCAES